MEKDKRENPPKRAAEPVETPEPPQVKDPSTPPGWVKKAAKKRKR